MNAPTPRLENLMTPATWLVVVAGLFLFLYSVYINQFSGSRVAAFEAVAFSGQLPFADTQSLFGKQTITHEANAIELDPTMMPAKFQIQLITPARGQLDYLLVLVDERGNEVWREAGTQHWDKSGSSDTSEKLRTLGLTPFSLDDQGHYTLLASLQGGYDQEITLRRNVVAASMIIYAIAGFALLSGILLLVRGRQRSPENPA